MEWLDGIPGSFVLAPVGRDSLMTRFRIFDIAAFIMAPNTHKNVSGSLRITRAAATDDATMIRALPPTILCTFPNGEFDMLAGSVRLWLYLVRKRAGGF
jgi:hypothetical protein